MLLGAFLFIQLELEQHGPVRGFELSFFEIDAIAVRCQADAEYIMFVKNEVPFLFHPDQIVDPLSFGVLPAAPRLGDPCAILGKKTDDD